LQLNGAAIGDFVIKNRMRDQMIHSRFVSDEELLAACGGEIHCPAGAHKILCRDHPVVNRTEHCGLGDERPEFFHDIQRQHGTAEARLMIKADVWIETYGERGDRAIFCQQTVSEREQSVHWIGGRTAFASVKVEVESKLRIC